MTESKQAALEHALIEAVVGDGGEFSLGNDKATAYTRACAIRDAADALVEHLERESGESEPLPWSKGGRLWLGDLELGVAPLVVDGSWAGGMGVASASFPRSYHGSKEEAQRVLVEGAFDVASLHVKKWMDVRRRIGKARAPR